MYQPTIRRISLNTFQSFVLVNNEPCFRQRRCRWSAPSQTACLVLGLTQTCHPFERYDNLVLALTRGTHPLQEDVRARGAEEGL